MTGALELSAILVELLGYGLIIYVAFSVDRVLCHSRHLEEKPGLRFLCYVLSGGISFVFLRMVQNLKVGGWTRAALLLGLCLAARLVIYYVSEVIPERYQRQWMAESEKLLEENYQRLAAQGRLEALALPHLDKLPLVRVKSLSCESCGAVLLPGTDPPICRRCAKAAKSRK